MCAWPNRAVETCARPLHSREPTRTDRGLQWAGWEVCVLKIPWACVIPEVSRENVVLNTGLFLGVMSGARAPVGLALRFNHFSGVVSKLCVLAHNVLANGFPN